MRQHKDFPFPWRVFFELLVVPIAIWFGVVALVTVWYVICGG